MTNVKYVLDANVLIVLHRHLPQAMIPDLWSLLDELIQEQKLISHQIVYEELVPEGGPQDDVGRWAVKNKHCFRPVTQEQTNSLRSILLRFPKLIKPENPKNQADPWLVAMALEHQQNPPLFDPFEMVIVTDENPRSADKLPKACEAFGTRPINRFKFFEANGFQFSVTRR